MCPMGMGPSFSGVCSTLKVPAKHAGTLVDPVPLGMALIDTMIEIDEEVTARYFDGVPPTPEEISRLALEAVASGALIPVLCVSGKTGVGVSELLDALLLCSLPPDKVVRSGKTESGEERPIPADPAGPLAAQVFKTRIDPVRASLELPADFFRLDQEATTWCTCRARASR